jgi:hypothetical protein
MAGGFGEGGGVIRPKIKNLRLGKERERKKKGKKEKAP